jgi:hypothetical membrane protein
MQDNVAFVSSKPQRNQATRWLALAGVTGPIIFVVVFTIAGFLRPDYSPVRKSISTLGVGANAWLADADAVIFALLLLAFAIGFFLGMRRVIAPGWLVACLILFILSSVGIFNASIFPAASGTAWLHWTIGFLPAFLAPVGAYVIAGGQWLRVRGWRGYGWYSLATALGSIVLIFFSFALLSPRAASGGPATPIGGLIERILVLVAFAWPVVIGWRLFAQAGSQNLDDSRQEQAHA